jgi:hypothetical protein
MNPLYYAPKYRHEDILRLRKIIHLEILKDLHVFGPPEYEKVVSAIPSVFICVCMYVCMYVCMDMPLTSA